MNRHILKSKLMKDNDICDVVMRGKTFHTTVENIVNFYSKSITTHESIDTHNANEPLLLFTTHLIYGLV